MEFLSSYKYVLNMGTQETSQGNLLAEIVERITFANAIPTMNIAVVIYQ